MDQVLSKELKSVLIIDDNADDRYITRLILERIEACGKVYEASDGEEGLELLQDLNDNSPNEFPPALILLDINMPGMNGFEFLEEYEKREISKDPLLVISMFTSSSHESDLEKSKKFKAVKGYMVKPFHVNEFKEIVTRAFT